MDSEQLGNSIDACPMDVELAQERAVFFGQRFHRELHCLLKDSSQLTSHGPSFDVDLLRYRSDPVVGGLRAFLLNEFSGGARCNNSKPTTERPAPGIGFDGCWATALAYEESDSQLLPKVIAAQSETFASVRQRAEQLPVPLLEQLKGRAQPE